MHHRWTGWQDIDLTTQALVPRRLQAWERIAINFCWRFWVPVFSVLYRLQNYWNLPRLLGVFSPGSKRRRLTINYCALLLLYCAGIYVFGFERLLSVLGLATLLSFIMQDVLILSQHTHVPMELSHGHRVIPFPPKHQEVFTRSLKFPGWFSRLVLLNIAAHELHHMYPSVPGYHLHKIGYKTHNEVPWWRWLWKARSVPGEVFLFENSRHSGFDI